MTTTPRPSTAARLTSAARRIGACKTITAAALVAADSATRSLRAAAAHPLVRDISEEADGTWIYLAHGWRCCNNETNSIAEDTAAGALACLKRAYFEPDAEDMAEIEKDAAAARAKSDAADRAAAFRAAADRVLNDMASNAARVEAERAARLEALEAPRRAAYAAEALADLQAAAASAQDAMNGSGSAAQDAANSAWNAAAARDAATPRPTADGEAVDAVASVATLPASLVEAARAYLAAVAADCGVADAARHFGAEKDAVAFEHTGDAAAEARALISAADYNAACRSIDARRAARNA